MTFMNPFKDPFDRRVMWVGGAVLVALAALPIYAAAIGLFHLIKWIVGA